MKHTLRSVAIGVTVGVLAATGVTVAVAEIPSADGTITGCVNNSSGAVRIIDTAKTSCNTKSEKTVPWNQAGLPGISGYEIVTRDRIPGTGTGNDYDSESAHCPPGKVVVGGGAQEIGGFFGPGPTTTNRMFLRHSAPGYNESNNSGYWTASWDLEPDVVDGVRVFAICVNALP